jgi:hypothetical protein
MGLLVRSWRNDGVVEVIILAVEAEAFSLPGFEDDEQCLLKACLAFRIIDAIEVIGARGATAPDAEIEVPLADLIHRGRLFRDP